MMCFHNTKVFVAILLLFFCDVFQCRRLHGDSANLDRYWSARGKHGDPLRTPIGRWQACASGPYAIESL